MHLDGTTATVGISKFAVDQLTDLIMIELPAVGTRLVAGKSFGEIESVKAVSDLYAPVGGEVIEVNKAVADDVQLLADRPVRQGLADQGQGRQPPQTAELLDLAPTRRRWPKKHTDRRRYRDRPRRSARRTLESDDMAYIANTPDDVRVMLEAIGLDSLDQLFDMVPPEFRPEAAAGRPAAP